MLPQLLVVTLTMLQCVQARCPPGFTEHEDSCYFFSAEIKLKWLEALRMCEAIRGRLVSIESSSEQLYLGKEIDSILRDDAWIGGSSLNKVWHWAHDQSPLAFTNWAANEPNDQVDGDENCLEMDIQREHKWNDASCDVAKPFVCEAP